MTTAQLNKMLQENFAEYEKMKNTKSVQEITAFAEQLKRNPNLDIGVLFKCWEVNLTAVKCAKAQHSVLAKIAGNYPTAIEFLCIECDSIFSVLEGVPVDEVAAHLEIVTKLLKHLKQRNPEDFLKMIVNAI